MGRDFKCVFEGTHRKMNRVGGVASLGSLEELKEAAALDREEEKPKTTRKKKNKHITKNY